MKKFKNFWSPEEIDLMSTEQILLTLAELGIPILRKMKTYGSGLPPCVSDRESVVNRAPDSP